MRILNIKRIDEVCRKAVVFYGFEYFLYLIQKEACQLITSAYRCNRGEPNSIDELQEAIANMKIMLRQAAFIMDSKKIHEMMKNKIDEIEDSIKIGSLDRKKGSL